MILSFAKEGTLDAGLVEVRLDSEQQTLWFSLQQIADLFERDKSVISRHFRNIYTEGELDREATVAKNATVQFEGKRQVERNADFYNLDAIISMGYRVNLKKQHNEFQFLRGRYDRDIRFNEFT